MLKKHLVVKRLFVNLPVLFVVAALLGGCQTAPFSSEKSNNETAKEAPKEIAKRVSKEDKGHTDVGTPKYSQAKFLKAAILPDFTEAERLLRLSPLSINEYDFGDLYHICETWLTVRHYSNFNECLDEFGRQIDKQKYTKLNQTPLMSVSWNSAFGQTRIHTLLARRAIDFGDYETALKESRAAWALDTEGKISVAAHSLVNIFTLGARGAGKSSEDAGYLQSGVALGVLALSEALNGNHKQAQQHIRLLKVFANDSSNDFIENRLRYWMAMTEFVMEDYRGALAVAKLRDRGLMDAFTTAITPLLVVTSAVLGGGTERFLDPTQVEQQYVLARSLLGVGEIKKAKTVYDTLISDSRLKGFGDIYYRLLHDRGNIFYQQKQYDKAIIDFKLAVTAIENQRSSISTEAGKLGFSGGIQLIYADLINVLIENGRVDEAFNYVERAKARALVDMLANRQDIGADKKAKQYLSQITQSERQMLAFRGEGDSKRSLGDSARSNLKAEFPELSSLVTVDTLDSRKIGSLLGKDETLLEYYLNKDELVVFVLHNGKLTVHKLEGAGLAKNVSDFRKALLNADNQWIAPSKTLYKQLIQPIEKTLKTKRLLIVPHGPLHYLPFAALTNGQQFLVDKVTIRLLPSASVMAFLGNKKNTANKKLLVMGNPDVGNPEYDLPGAESESRVISSQWKGSSILLRKKATETALRNSGQNYTHLHFASHGEFDTNEPLNSRLLLAPDNKNDGNLTVGELYGLKLKADLVTLSACETGLGDISSGDDVVGLTRGFLYAGAEAIVASLWSVEDDPTAYFMKDFYRNLKQQNKASALRTAQLNTRKKFPHPYHWAAFQLTGSGI